MIRPPTLPDLGGVGAAVETETDPRSAVAPEPTIRCARCEAEITRPDERVSRGGAHLHDRINPSGHVFRFGCFASAPGARVEGETSLEATWFAGHAWRFAACAACGAHLGWRWEGPSGTFFGLILAALRGV